MNIFFTIIRKDLKLFFGGTGFFYASVLFSLSLFSLFRFTLPPDSSATEAGISILWGVHTAASLFLLISSQQWEWQNKAYRRFMTAGIEPALVYAAKGVTLSLAISLLWLSELAIWGLFSSDSLVGIDKAEMISIILYFALSGLLVSLAIAFSGQIAAVIALHSNFRYVMLMILFFPLVLPVVIAGSTFCREYLKTAELMQQPFYLISGAVFFYLAAGILLYGVLWEE